jgi:hypothetical protein
LGRCKNIESTLKDILSSERGSLLKYFLKGILLAIIASAISTFAEIFPET